MIELQWKHILTWHFNQNLQPQVTGRIPAWDSRFCQSRISLYSKHENIDFSNIDMAQSIVHTFHEILIYENNN